MGSSQCLCQNYRMAKAFRLELQMSHIWTFIWDSYKFPIPSATLKYKLAHAQLTVKVDFWNKLKWTCPLCCTLLGLIRIVWLAPEGLSSPDSLGATLEEHPTVTISWSTLHLPLASHPLLSYPLFTTMHLSWYFILLCVRLINILWQIKRLRSNQQTPKEILLIIVICFFKYFALQRI